MKIEPLFLFDDEPVKALEADFLDFKPLASVIAATTIGTPGPFNIGVFGGWGHGKTSIMKLAQKLIDDNDADNQIVTVWVNAWKFEHDEYPIVPLVASIVNEVDKRIVELDKKGRGFLDGTKKVFQKISRALRAIAYGFSAKTKVGIPGYGEIEAGFIAEKIIDRYEEISKIPRDPLLDKSIFYHADELLADLSDSSDLMNSPKIVVFIDDLDRCLPPKALRLLEGIKLVLAHRGFVFIIGVDRRIIDSFLEERYRKNYGLADYAKDGSRYLDKLIQLPLYLPSHETRFEEFIESIIESKRGHLDPKLIKVFCDLKKPLATGSNRNPRAFIRTLNRLLVDYFLWNKRKESIKNDKTTLIDNESFLGLAVVARILEEHLGASNYRSLARNKFLCEQIEGAIGFMDNPQIDIIEAIYKYKKILPQVKGQKKANNASEENLKSEMRIIESNPLIQEINRYIFIKELLKSEYGKIWLKSS